MSIETSLDSPDLELPPRRLSALYQYHNAPEVAPAHGLEYDDSGYTASDKCLAIREAAVDDSYYGSQGYGRSLRAPRIIFGMKVQTFLWVALAMILVIVGASVGGAVGGHSIQSHDGSTIPSLTNGTSSISTTATPMPTPSASQPRPYSDCISSDNSTYTAPYTQKSSTGTTDPAGLIFTKHCSLANPLAQPGTLTIGEAFVSSFSNCINTCAAYNHWNAGTNCSVAVFNATSAEPGNCWIGDASGVDAASLSEVPGIDIALLNP